MSSVLHYPPVTDELLQEGVRRILSAGSPLKIILFGSRARGTARPDSDLDLLIIEESDLPRYKRAVRYLRALVGLFPEKTWWYGHQMKCRNGQRFPMLSSPRP